MKVNLKWNSPIFKAILVLVAMTVFGYIGLDVSEEYVEEVIDEQLSVSESVTTETSGIESGKYRVLSVIDGDTLVVDINGERQTVRVLGIDTPETEHSPIGEECYAKESTDKARALLQNTHVVLETDPDQDKTDVYDRLLAYVGMENGEDFGEIMVSQGYAKEFTFKSTVYKNQSKYKALEKNAKEKPMGLWACET